MLAFNYLAKAQVKLPSDYNCFKTETGYGLANTNFSFYRDDLKKAVGDDELIADYLSGFTKYKDGIFVKSSASEFYYEVADKNTLETFILRAKKDKTQFQAFKQQLLKAVLQRKTGEEVFLKSDGSRCN